ncbi:TonB family protein [Stenotrophomonas maltophilia]|uniref:Energy transducer TonB n=1 Tax=Stenotrophomonas maltophilia TaxID=40324 RepID=A0A270NAG2_STEMA|nr:MULTISPECIES: energy transducer TonB [Stenotrophomonas maltophilia group]MBN7917562.1 TonB family protein [Stenotrophomonas maltophilia]MBO2907144.1 TonB family protein [Stenotrophomonas maltophilia]MBO2918986.1 TonB family protein [Stenotrophomonas maltophilia]PAM68272.1 energy transducer TonB [Stenotrophomonas maltophilia]PZT34951.1 energy transducer TonB [Stenotrophomonas sepilia]
MTEQLVVHRYEQPDDKGLSWPRIVGIAFVIALHLAAFMMLLIPAVAPKAVAEKERNVMVTIVDAPPPQAPVVDVPEPRPNDIVTPPSPPAPPAPPTSIEASVDISSKAMNPPRYPPAAFRAGIQGEVILIIDVDASGNVTNVTVEKSSRNRDLDRAAMEAARKWRFNAAEAGGKKTAGRVRVPVNFALN